MTPILVCHHAWEVRAAASRAAAWRHRIWGKPAPATLVPAPKPAAPPVHVKLNFGRARVADVIDTACAIWGITRDELIGHDRHSKFMLPRHAAIVVARRVTGFSFPDLGRRFGGRDHTSIIHAVRRADHHAGLQAAIAELMAALDAAAVPPVAEREGAGRG